MTGIPGGAVGYGLKTVGGAAAQDGSDGRDVVGGGCTPLSARATATNNHPWSIHGGFIRQVHRVHLFISFHPLCYHPFFSSPGYFEVLRSIEIEVRARSNASMTERSIFPIICDSFRAHRCVVADRQVTLSRTLGKRRSNDFGH